MGFQFLQYYSAFQSKGDLVTRVCDARFSCSTPC